MVKISAPTVKGIVSSDLFVDFQTWTNWHKMAEDGARWAGGGVGALGFDRDAAPGCSRGCVAAPPFQVAEHPPQRTQIFLRGAARREDFWRGEGAPQRSLLKDAM